VRGQQHQLDFLRDIPTPRQPEFFITPAGRRVAWNEYGDPAGRPLMYHHGWPSSRLQACLLHHLARERGIRVLALDRPGIGRSEREPNRRLEAWPELVAAFADALGIDRFVQLGVSGGGPYALACAAMLPGRVTASAVLCGAVPLAETDHSGLHPFYRWLIPLRKLPRGCFTPPIRLIARLATWPAHKAPVSWILATLPASDRQLLLTHPEAQKVLAESFVEGVRQGGRGVMEDADIYFQKWKLPLDAISGSVRYWHGGHDRNISAKMASGFVATIPHARLDVDPEEGHFSLAIHRAPDAMDFLAAAD
jgi:pimeloyl-ACP methyl ester carboxylesterase